MLSILTSIKEHNNKNEKYFTIDYVEKCLIIIAKGFVDCNS